MNYSLKKNFSKILLITGLFVFSFLGNTADAADSWLYWTKEGNGGAETEFGQPGRSVGYALKADCEKDLATVNTSGGGRTKSPACYKGSPVTITSFKNETTGSTTDAKVGDMIEIKGTNLIGVTGILIGNSGAGNYASGTVDADNTVARAKVIAGNGTGKIAITTKYRGSATSTKELKIAAEEVRFWFTNVVKDIYGPDGGYKTEAECIAEHTKYNSSNGVTTGDTSCKKGTLAEWQAQKDSEGPLLPQDPAYNIDPKTEVPPVNNKVYTLLAPIGGLKCIDTSGVDPTCSKGGIGDYLNIIFKLAIGLCGALAVVMIVISSIQYMGDESVFGKTEAKSKILSAILGLFIALGAYALLNTISPDLLGENGVEISQASLEIEGDTNAPISKAGSVSLPTGIVCSGGKANIPTIAKSFSGKMTYAFGAKGTAGPNSTIQLDCSGFTNYVLQCAGVPFVNSGTSDIFKNAEKVTSMTNTAINNKALAPGDLLGWVAGENGEKFGHVMIYIGNGQIADSHGPSKPVKPGQALGTFSPSKYQNRIKYIKRAP